MKELEQHMNELKNKLATLHFQMDRTSNGRIEAAAQVMTVLEIAATACLTGLGLCYLVEKYKHKLRKHKKFVNKLMQA